jgi:NAD(P)-dependent dehydrogenase (short-subunit alcohol dehydrogenase family)
MSELADRTIVLTGATAGIGRATAIALARRGARLLLLGRDPARGEDTLAEIERQTGRTDVVLLRGDLASLDEVRRLAGEILERTDAIHVLLNNAGVTLARRTTTVDGHEATFAINHLAPFALTGLLLPRLLESAPARIVTVASDAHKFGRIDLDDLQSERRYGVMRTYGASKGANILFTQELARRLEGSGVTANCLHPGGIRSNLGRGNGPVLDLFQRAVGVFLRSPEQGAETSVYLATSPDLAEANGLYYARCREHRPADHARDPETAARLWRASEELTQVRYPETPVRASE